MQSIGDPSKIPTIPSSQSPTIKPEPAYDSVPEITPNTAAGAKKAEQQIDQEVKKRELTTKLLILSLTKAGVSHKDYTLTVKEFLIKKVLSIYLNVAQSDASEIAFYEFFNMLHENTFDETAIKKSFQEIVKDKNLPLETITNILNIICFGKNDFNLSLSSFFIEEAKHADTSKRNSSLTKYDLYQSMFKALLRTKEHESNRMLANIKEAMKKAETLFEKAKFHTISLRIATEDRFCKKDCINRLQEIKAASPHNSELANRCQLFDEMYQLNETWDGWDSIDEYKPAFKYKTYEDYLQNLSLEDTDATKLCYLSYQFHAIDSDISQIINKINCVIIKNSKATLKNHYVKLGTIIKEFPDATTKSENLAFKSIHQCYISLIDIAKTEIRDLNRIDKEHIALEIIYKKSNEFLMQFNKHVGKLNTDLEWMFIDAEGQNLSNEMMNDSQSSEEDTSATTTTTTTTSTTESTRTKIPCKKFTISPTIEQFIRITTELDRELSIALKEQLKDLRVSSDNAYNPSNKMRRFEKEIGDHLSYATRGLELLYRACLDGDLYSLGAITPFFCMDIHLLCEQSLKHAIAVKTGDIVLSHNLKTLLIELNLPLTAKQKQFIDTFKDGMLQARYPIFKMSRFGSLPKNTPLHSIAYSRVISDSLFRSFMDENVYAKLAIGLKEHVLFAVESYRHALNITASLSGVEIDIDQKCDELKAAFESVHWTNQTLAESSCRVNPKNIGNHKLRDLIITLDKVDDDVEESHVRCLLNEALEHTKILHIIEYLQDKYQSDKLAMWHERNLMSVQWILEQLYAVKSALSNGVNLRDIPHHNLVRYHQWTMPDEEIPEDLELFNLGRKGHYGHEAEVRGQNHELVTNLLKTRQCLKKKATKENYNEETRNYMSQSLIRRQDKIDRGISVATELASKIFPQYFLDSAEEL